MIVITADSAQLDRSTETGSRRRSSVRTAQSCTHDPRAAAREFYASVAQPDMALVIFFCSSDYDLAALGEEMRHLFAGVQIVGCTTAGEIGPAGYLDHSITGVSFPADSFNAVTGRIDRLRQFETAASHPLAQDLLQRLESISPHADINNSFALLLIDGMSGREEAVARTLQVALGRLRLLGGSAGDGLRFRSTQVYFDGRFHSDSAVLLLMTTRLPFKLLKTQHFVATSERLVVTEADPDRRIIREINGLPAAEEYARILGTSVSDLGPLCFATSPVVVMIDGMNYVRSIQKANPDGSLTLFCAIDEGVVLRVARGANLLQNLEAAFAEIRAEIGPPQLVLGFECIHRKLEASLGNLKHPVGEVFLRNNTVGFNTYGEQFLGMHVNQTLVGIAFGEPMTETEGA